MTTPTGSTRTVSSNTTTNAPVVQHDTYSRSVATTETKPAFKTTELLFYVLAVASVLIATQIVDGFRAHQGWLYVTILTVGYMLSRGIAKAGSYAKDNDPRTDAYPNSNH